MDYNSIHKKFKINNIFHNNIQGNSKNVNRSP